MKSKYILTGVLALLLWAPATIVNAELVVIANPQVAFNTLTQGELRRIFLGQTGIFPNGELAVPLDVSGDFRNAFYEYILQKTPAQVENYWTGMIFTGRATPPRQIRPQDVKQTVADSPKAISYMDRSQVDTSVKIINIVSAK